MKFSFNLMVSRADAIIIDGVEYMYLGRDKSGLTGLCPPENSNAPALKFKPQELNLKRGGLVNAVDVNGKVHSVALKTLAPMALSDLV